VISLIGKNLVGLEDDYLSVKSGFECLAELYEAGAYRAVSKVIDVDTVQKLADRHREWTFLKPEADRLVQILESGPPKGSKRR